MFFFHFLILSFFFRLGALFRKSITLEKNKCTYLELCGSINDALWDDETQNSNKVQQRRGVKRSKQTEGEIYLSIEEHDGEFLRAEELSCGPDSRGGVKRLGFFPPQQRPPNAAHRATSDPLRLQPLGDGGFGAVEFARAKTLRTAHLKR